VQGAGKRVSRDEAVQLTFFDFLEDPIVQKLKAVDVNKLTPLEALALLAELAEQARRGRNG